MEINPNYKSKRIELDADVKTPSVLLLSERCYNAQWQVDVDGKPAPLLPLRFHSAWCFASRPAKLQHLVFHYAARLPRLFT